MILWPIISGVLFWQMFFGKTPESRRTSSILFAGWMMLSVGLLIIGADPSGIE